ncbi:TRAP transporter substrate-binding protein [Alteribacillus bidgolensis]|uniref:Tripartite ATP-independent transporter solute receptor, DctP family n=1 Tax=Alteribacillus bidgolensis TaxID=930129 RepID=A0A1G8H0C0_9BACI|nr:TRAP transporter substrate-binding protein [Alteribacillus bidgolensis]SDI00095.1 tripartite ATP-independent transporter solute receptor, DctP family [Alteribacillus bidgolensis]
MKKSFIFTLMLLLILALAACSSLTDESSDENETATGADSEGTEDTAAEEQDSGENANSEEEEISIRLGSHLPPSHSVIAVTEKFEDIVESQSNGRIGVNIHPSGELGGQSELIQSLQVGSLEMTINDAGVLSNFAPKVGVLDLPYTFSSYEHVHDVLDSPVAETLEEELAAVDIKSIGWVDSAFRDLLINEEISRIKGVDGMSLRVPDAPQYSRTVESWGASATSIPWGDLYNSLETGVADGFEGSAESIYSDGLHEVVEYRVPTEHIFTVLSLNISQQFYDELSSEDQTLIEEAGREAALYGRELAMERDEEYKEQLAEEGLETLDIDKEEFRESAMEFVNSYAEEEGMTDLLEQIAELE